jgi:hypothetical protein
MSDPVIRPLPFAKACARAAENIKKGSLLPVHKNSMAVSTSSFDNLSGINKLGLLTINSQNGEKNERAYIRGFMNKVAGAALIHEINLSSSSLVAFQELCVPDNRWSNDHNTYTPICVTRYKSRAFTTIVPFMDEGQMAPMARGARYGQANEQGGKYQRAHEATLKSKDRKMDPSLIFVTVFDPQYGRDANGVDGLFTVTRKMLVKISKSKKGKTYEI